MCREFQGRTYVLFIKRRGHWMRTKIGAVLEPARTWKESWDNFAIHGRRESTEYMICAQQRTWMYVLNH